MWVRFPPLASPPRSVLARRGLGARGVGTIGAMPTFHFGRMVDHVHLRVRDLDASRRFYLGALASLGLEPGMQGDGYFQIDELFVSADGPPTTNCTSPSRPPSARRSTASTRRRWPPAAATTAPRASARYHPGYYAAFVLDPDGNNIEAVHHGEGKRSAASVEIEVELPGKDTSAARETVPASGRPSTTARPASGSA